MSRLLLMALSMMTAGIAQGSAMEAGAAPDWCREAKLNPSENQICHSERLSQLDGAMMVAFERALLESAVFAPSLRRMQFEWLRSRDACGYSGQCLEREYRDQISFLETFSQKGTAFPQRNSPAQPTGPIARVGN